MAMTFVLEDEFSEESAQLLARVAREGAVVPTLWDYEVSNICTMAQRRGRLSEAAVAQALGGFARLPIERVSHTNLMHDLVTAAAIHALSAYDAAYLVLAMELNLPLATLDAKLREAAVVAGVEVLPTR